MCKIPKSVGQCGVWRSVKTLENRVFCKKHGVKNEKMTTTLVANGFVFQNG